MRASRGLKYRVLVEPEEDGGFVAEVPSRAHLEARFLLLGLSANLRTLVVCHAYRAAEDVWIRGRSSTLGTCPRRRGSRTRP